MTKMIQIRHVPDEVHRKLKAKAAKEGISLSELLLREATTIADTPSIQEWLERARQLTPIEMTREEIVEMIRADRESH